MHLEFINGKMLLQEHVPQKAVIVLGLLGPSVLIVLFLLLGLQKRLSQGLYDLSRKEHPWRTVDMCQLPGGKHGLCPLHYGSVVVARWMAGNLYFDSIRRVRFDNYVLVLFRGSNDGFFEPLTVCFYKYEVFASCLVYMYCLCFDNFFFIFR